MSESFSVCVRFLFGCVAAVVLGSFSVAQAVPASDARVIVKLRAEADAPTELNARQRHFQSRLDDVARRQSLPALRGAEAAIGSDHRVVRASGIDAGVLAERLSRDPGVAYAVPDRRVRRAAVPSDPLFTVGGAGGPAVGQWYLRSPTAQFVSAINAEGAWEYSRGSASVVVAVLDTGIRAEHPDFTDKLVAGYDFVSGTNSNDGDDRDADPSDPGDWVSQTDISTGIVNADCEIRPSSWHGTKVAGIIAAGTDNGIGMAGVGWNVKVMPVRVLGKCDGRQSDIIAAMRWAAGIAVPGLPSNPNPVRVINLSLGSSGRCDAAYADAIRDVSARGVVVVAAAGNTTGHALSAPANCAGVIGVTALRHIGTKVGFSDLGAEATIAAPGGNCVNAGAGDPCLYPILTTANNGLTSPGGSTYSDSYDFSVGTSFSAPQVAGAVALMLSAQPALTPTEVRSALMASARPFPTSGAAAGTPQCRAPSVDATGAPVDQLECYCTTTTCGAGMLDVQAAVFAVQGVQARITLSPTAPQPKQLLTLSAADTLLASGRQIALARWTLISGGGIVTALSATEGLSVSATPTGVGSFSVALTVTDSAGATSTLQRVIDVTLPTPVDHGGGGGALGLGGLLLLALAVVMAARRPAARPRTAPARH